MEREGYIKFQCDWKKSNPLEEGLLRSLIHWRDVLHEYGFIGAHPDGTGFGNISRRLEENRFIISGSGTGHILKIRPEHFSLVTGFDINKNYLKCEGPVKASSESLTHGVIYREAGEVHAVIHIHHLGFWNKLLALVPATSKEAAYGTPEMAFEIRRLFRETDVRKQKILVMGGHEEGIVSFGKDLKEAAEVLFRFARDLDIH